MSPSTSASTSTSTSTSIPSDIVHTLLSKSLQPVNFTQQHLQDDTHHEVRNYFNTTIAGNDENEIWFFTLPTTLRINEIAHIDLHITPHKHTDISVSQAQLQQPQQHYYPHHIQCMNISDVTYCLYEVDATLYNDIVTFMTSDDTDDENTLYPSQPFYRCFNITQSIGNHHDSNDDKKNTQHHTSTYATHRPVANPSFIPPKQAPHVGMYRPIGYLGNDDNAHQIGYRSGVSHMIRREAEERRKQTAAKSSLELPSAMTSSSTSSSEKEARSSSSKKHKSKSKKHGRSPDDSFSKDEKTSHSHSHSHETKSKRHKHKEKDKDKDKDEDKDKDKHKDKHSHS